MDTLVTIQIDAKGRNGNEILQNAFQLISSLEDRLSFYKDDSLIRLFNEGRSERIKLNTDLQNMVALATELYAISDHKFDITIGRLTELWDFEAEIIPSDVQIRESIEFVGLDKLQIIEGFLTKPEGMKINLGGMAKGFIIDKTVEFLKSQSVESGFVNAGGDIRIFGKKKPLRIGIQHPRKPDQIIDKIWLNDIAVVTSGDYERSFEKEGKRYHHIIDPQSGYPSANCISVTLIAKETLLADAYSTALFLLPPSKAVTIAENDPRLEAIIFFENDGVIEHLETSGMEIYRKGN
jgi:thiamine biosynthesis lipoprotein